MRNPEAWSRRRFVRRAGAFASVFATPALPVWLSACGGERVRPDDPADRIVSAVRLPNGAVGLVDVDEGPPAAYVSRSRRTVWVDRDWRDRAHFLLGAYTSVSTGLWRIPLMGDDPRAPIVPGDEDREFEAVELVADDLPPVPSPGDIRVHLGIRRRILLDAACRTIDNLDDQHDERPAPGDAWLTGGPWAVLRFVERPGDPGPAPSGDATPGVGGREAFSVVGAGHRHLERACGGPGASVSVWAWTAGEATPDG